MIDYLADRSNVFPQPIGIEISDVMAINGDDSYRKEVILSLLGVSSSSDFRKHLIPMLWLSPLSGSYSLSRRETRVDFPVPLDPTTAMTVPAGTIRLRFWKIGASLRVGYAKEMSTNSMPPFSCSEGSTSPSVAEERKGGAKIVN